MQRRTMYIAGGAATAAVALAGGVGAAGMGGGDDEPLTGETHDRAVEAALAHTGGGEAIETEAEDDGDATYSVEVRMGDGSVVEVELDASFQVVGTEQEDDDGDDGPLTGETLEQASAAALAPTGGGTVVDSETESGPAAYSVEVRLDDGSEVEVDLDESFQVVGSEPDDADGDDNDEDDDDEEDDD